jgi:hypothetical protein
VDASDEQTLTGAVGRRGFRYVQTLRWVYVDVRANPNADNARFVLGCNGS